MSNIKKVILLSKSDMDGGAAIASLRLFHSLKKNSTDWETNMLVQQALSSGDGLHSLLRGKIGNYVSLGLLGYEKLKFLSHEKNATTRFQFSTANIGLPVYSNKFVKKADIIHLHWFNQGFISINGLKNILKLDKPVLWTMHDMWSFTGGCHFTGFCERYINSCGNCPLLKNPSETDLSTLIFNEKQLVYKKYPKLTFVTCSDWLKTKAQNSKLLGKMRIETIPNPIDTLKYKPEDKSVSRRKLNLPTNKKILLFGSARLNDKRKGFVKLIRALQILRKDHPEYENNLIVLLFGQVDEETPRLIPFKSVSLGKLDDPTLAYQAADLFVLPSLEDNLPNTIMEAMSCGIPSLAFNTGGIPEMIDHLKNGYLCQYGSEQSLAEGIFTMLSSEKLAEFSINARMKVETTFSEKVISEKYISLYNELYESR
jgi:glycosyltransferase involved in cell wall biosynthesis